MNIAERTKIAFELINNMPDEEFIKLVNKYAQPTPKIELKNFDQLLEMRDDLHEWFSSYIKFDERDQIYVLVFEHYYSNRIIQYYKPCLSPEPLFSILKQLNYSGVSIEF